jgi:LEA14-like dessication related protein
MLGTLKTVLLGSKLKILFTLVLALGVVVVGGYSAGLLGAPSVAGVQNQFGDVTDETTEIETDLVVNNPNPVGVSLGDLTVSYDVLMNDVEMANGTKEGVSIGSGTSTVAFTTHMQNDRIPAWWASHVRNGEHTTVRVDAEVRSGTLGRSFDAPPVEEEVSTDLISNFNSTDTREVNADQPLVSDPVAYVNETSAQWGEVTDARTPIDTRFVVYNAKTAPMAITEIGYEITMNDVQVGNGTTDREYVIEGHSTRTIRTETVIRNQQLDEWWVSHIQNDQVTQLRIDFYAKVEVAGETFRVPLDELTYEQTVETDIFGNKGQSDTDATNASQTTDEGDENGDGTTTDEEAATTGGDGTATTAGDETATTPEETTSESGGSTTTTDDGVLALGPTQLR